MLYHLLAKQPSTQHPHNYVIVSASQISDYTSAAVLATTNAKNWLAAHDILTLNIVCPCQHFAKYD